MKLISWNVNGLRACERNGRFSNYVSRADCDFFCVQETKISNKSQINLNLKNYNEYWNYSKVKKGYSGTAIFAKKKPLNVVYDIENDDEEGRIITLEYDKFYLVNCYSPNSQLNISRLNYRLDWNDEFKNFIQNLNNKKDVILCGDMNVAHKDIDVCESFRGKIKTGFTPEERMGFDELLEVRID